MTSLRRRGFSRDLYLVRGESPSYEGIKTFSVRSGVVTLANCPVSTGTIGPPGANSEGNEYSQSMMNKSDPTKSRMIWHIRAGRLKRFLRTSKKISQPSGIMTVVPGSVSPGRM